MSGEGELIERIVMRCCASIGRSRNVLTQLDQAIGDGDHGVNMARGFLALHAAFEENRDQEFSVLCRTLGMALVLNVGGASGPLFGSLIIGLGTGVGHFPETIAEVRSALVAGTEAVKRRGKSDAGAKTMLDVLVPICEALDAPGTTITTVRKCADNSLEETRDMVATKGRSAFLGERSRGHLDPGAMSVCLLTNAVCDVLEEAP